MTFALDKSGVLVGYKTISVIEQPEVIQDSKGKFALSEELTTLSMNSNIIINSYNDSKNEEAIESFRSELEK